jgi:hypothetical protein
VNNPAGNFNETNTFSVCQILEALNSVRLVVEGHAAQFVYALSQIRMLIWPRRARAQHLGTFQISKVIDSKKLILDRAVEEKSHVNSAPLFTSSRRIHEEKRTSPRKLYSTYINSIDPSLPDCRNNGIFEISISQMDMEIR